MSLTRLYAEKLLFASTLSEKLEAPDLPALKTDLASSSYLALRAAPDSPGRPTELIFRPDRKAVFPDLKKIEDDRVRGEILHFFANHELLALELMALVILKFPEAPAAFRLSMLQTIAEEQNHMRLYLSRMRELDVQFGELPVSSYFWRHLRAVSTPLEFVTQMSLTLEQANLDFSLFFRNAVKEIGDQRTAEILDTVYREEIGHVKNGVAWFNQWRGDESRATESDWDAYQRILPPPMNPRRAKGFGADSLFDESARKKAGLSETFIQELKHFSGTKGRPPILWFYNPFCDLENARGKVGFSPKNSLKRMRDDLEPLMLYLASPQDTILVRQKPSVPFLEKLRAAGIPTPDFETKAVFELTEPKFGGFQPWGWSPESIDKFKPIQERLVQTSDGNAAWCRRVLDPKSRPDLKSLFSKSTGVSLLEQSLACNDFADFRAEQCVGRVFREIGECLAYLRETWPARKLLAKAPLSTSGQGLKRILTDQDLTEAFFTWIRQTIHKQGSIVIEPLLEKLQDVSIQLEIHPDRADVLEARPFLTGTQFEYRGSCLGPYKAHLDEDVLIYFQKVLPHWNLFARGIANELKALGYEGPAGIDAMIFKRADGNLAFKPLVEINPRFTMGRVAIELEKRVLPGKPALWLFLSSKKHGDLRALSETLEHDFPLVMKRTGRAIESGVLITHDSAQATEVITALFVGVDAVNEARRRFLQS